MSAEVLQSLSTENPHTARPKCISCHTTKKGKKENIRFEGDVLRLCLSCHDGEIATREPHPFGRNPDKTLKYKIPENFPLQNGRLTCLTCHDIESQCLRKTRKFNEYPKFLRGNPDWRFFCFQCHPKESYEVFNVHKQLDLQGEPLEEVCLWCHVKMPSMNKKASEARYDGLRDEDHLICENCHGNKKSHPIEGMHILIVPSKKTLKAMATYTGYTPGEDLAYSVFPLEQKGRLTCSSCHNSHEKGLFPNSQLRALGADLKKAKFKRLRQFNPKDPICQACHNM